VIIRTAHIDVGEILKIYKRGGERRGGAFGGRRALWAHRQEVERGGKEGGGPALAGEPFRIRVGEASNPSGGGGS